MVYLISLSPTLLDVIKAALKTNAVFHASDSQAFISAVLTHRYSKEACLIVDLATVSDAEHVITFTKSSATISRLPIVVLGTDEQIHALSEGVRPSISGFLSAPYTPGEVAMVIASVCDRCRDSENGGQPAAE